MRREAEADFDELAQALAAGSRTAFGIVRPSKRRCGKCTPRQRACRDLPRPGHAATMRAAQEKHVRSAEGFDGNERLFCWVHATHA